MESQINDLEDGTTMYMTQHNVPHLSVYILSCRSHCHNGSLVFRQEWHLREEGIKDPLPSEQRMVGSQLLIHWTQLTHWPHLHHGVLGLLPIKLSLQNHILIGTKPRQICLRHSMPSDFNHNEMQQGVLMTYLEPEKHWRKALGIEILYWYITEPTQSDHWWNFRALMKSI